MVTNGFASLCTRYGQRFVHQRFVRQRFVHQRFVDSIENMSTILKKTAIDRKDTPLVSVIWPEVCVLNMVRGLCLQNDQKSVH